MTTAVRTQVSSLRRSTALLAFTALMLGWTHVAGAQMTIRRPGVRPHYAFELEPHALFGAFEPPGPGSGSGFGFGVRGTIEVAPDGFIKSLNDSVGVGFGVDGLRYAGSGYYDGRCRRFEPGPAGTRICVEVDQYGGPSDYFFGNVVMQWNFWLHKRWSVFGEPGIAIYMHDGNDFGIAPALFVGGRFHFNDKIALTLRLGYPSISLGVSFLL